MIWSGLVWSGCLCAGLSGLVWSGLVWSGLVWSGLVWSGLVWSGLVWSGLVWSGLVCLSGLSSFSSCFLFCFLSQILRFRHKGDRSEEHTSELQSLSHLICRLLLENK